MGSASSSSVLIRRDKSTQSLMETGSLSLSMIMRRIQEAPSLTNRTSHSMRPNSSATGPAMPATTAAVPPEGAPPALAFVVAIDSPFLSVPGGEPCREVPTIQKSGSPHSFIQRIY